MRYVGLGAVRHGWAACRLALPPLVLLAMASIQSLAQNAFVTEAPSEIALDMDRDGKQDRAVLIKDPASGATALVIYMAAESKTPAEADKPTFRKDNLTFDPILAFKDGRNGSLIVTYGRGGSNQYEITLTIVHRKGRFVVGGLTKSWDMRSGIGSCDINFLTGKGVASRGLGASKPIKAKFRAVTLDDWSEDKQPKACG